MPAAPDAQELKAELQAFTEADDARDAALFHGASGYALPPDDTLNLATSAEIRRLRVVGGTEPSPQKVKPVTQKPKSGIHNLAAYRDTIDGQMGANWCQAHPDAFAALLGVFTASADSATLAAAVKQSADGIQELALSVQAAVVSLARIEKSLSTGENHG